jgi:HPt (histidine-containing phosphotransfer) domain-containing protein
MDGIEATAIIRDWEIEQMSISNESAERIHIPIIALTANAVYGVREMFIEKGFDDFLAKPVDISAMDEILNNWIPKKKRESGIEDIKSYEINYDFPDINGIDVQSGIKMTGGTEEGYWVVLSTFRKDTLERIKTLQNAINVGNLNAFTTHIHAIKSAAAAIGAAELSKEAAKLEKAGKEGDKAYINGTFNKFSEKLFEITREISTALETERAAAGDNSKTSSGNDQLISKLLELEKALKSKKADNIDRILEGIIKLPQDENTRETIEKISDNVLMTEFDNAVKIIEEFLNGNNCT